MSLTDSELHQLEREGEAYSEELTELIREVRAARAWRKEAELLLREIAKLFTYGDDCQECAIAKDPLVAKLGAFLGEGEGTKG